MSGNRETPDAGSDDKAGRLAQALRQNLRRRKAQAEARAGGAASEGRDAAHHAPADSGNPGDPGDPGDDDKG